jgi:hypothetical protein
MQCVFFKQRSARKLAVPGSSALAWQWENPRKIDHLQRDKEEAALIALIDPSTNT